MANLRKISSNNFLPRKSRTKKRKDAFILFFTLLSFKYVMPKKTTFWGDLNPGSSNLHNFKFQTTDVMRLDFRLSNFPSSRIQLSQSVSVDFSLPTEKASICSEPICLTYFAIYGARLTVINYTLGKGLH